MTQWKNEYGISIRKGCISCKHSMDADADLKKKLCSIDDDNDSNEHPRRFCCNCWEARDVYKWIGSGRTVTGALARPGDIKSPQYFKWLLRNANEAWMPGSPSDKQYLFHKTYPNLPLFIIKS